MEGMIEVYFLNFKWYEL